MAHCAHSHDAVPALHVGLAVPSERRHAMPALHAESFQHPRHRTGTLAQGGIANAGEAAVKTARDHILGGVPLRCMVDHSIKCQREVLHGAVCQLHAGTSGGSGGEMMPTFQFH